MGGGNPLKKLEKQVKRSAKDVEKHATGKAGLAKELERVGEDVAVATGLKMSDQQKAAMAAAEEEQRQALEAEEQETAQRKRRMLRARRGRASLIAQDEQGLGV